MQDDTSANDVAVEPAVETPVTDDVLNILSDTEDQAPAEVVETPEPDTEPEAEAPEEAETPEEPIDPDEPDLQAGEDEPIDPAEENRRRYEERQAAKAEREQRVREQTQPYVEGAEDEYDGRLRNMEVADYNRQIESTENTLISEFERAKANPELQIFNPDSKEYIPKAYDKAMRDYNAGYIVYDQYGNMVGTKGSLIEHLTETADLLKGAVQTGAVQQVRATRQMRSGADTKPAAQPKEAPKDSILDILKSD